MVRLKGEMQRRGAKRVENATDFRFIFSLRIKFGFELSFN
jgi:hypothetical protein